MKRLVPRLIPRLSGLPLTGGETRPPLSMTQEWTAHGRIFQRATTTGGAANKGEGAISLPIYSREAASIYARLRSATDGTTILQAAFVAGAAPAGSSVVALSGLSAFNEWAYLDIATSAAGPWVLGTKRMGLGRIIGISGQSQAGFTLYRNSDDDGTLISGTINDKTALYAAYGSSYLAPAWAQVSDAGPYSSSFPSQFLNLQNIHHGVLCGYVGYARGSTRIEDWSPGGLHNPLLRSVLDYVGGFEAFIWYQGGDNTGDSQAEYQAKLDILFADLTAHNAVRGSNYTKVLTAMGTRIGGQGTNNSVRNIRRAHEAWALANSGIYVEPHDIDLIDEVHQSQSGNIVLARHYSRALSSFGDVGPKIVSGVRTGPTTIVLTLEMNPLGSSTPVLTGTATSYRRKIRVFPTGTFVTPMGIIDMVASANTLTLTLQTDPGAVAVDVYGYPHPDPDGAAYNNNIYDNYNPEGLPRGRLLQQNLYPVVVAPA